jgi:sulfite reductase (NADPH) flavoprotein alpha-component
MILSIWRYSHFILAISTAVFVLIASVTGLILAFEPISNQLHPYAIDDAKSKSLAEVIESLKTNYNEIYSLEIDENGFLKASVLDKNGDSGHFYIDPKTGSRLGEQIKKKPIFEFATNLHRSLFLKSTGRFIMGFVSLLLFLIAITGVLLVARRQGGFKHWSSKVLKEDVNQYVHVVLGRYALIPIIVITLTGVFLSLERFSLLPYTKSEHIGAKIDQFPSASKPENFKIFKTSKLSDLVSLEFPFSTDEDDFYILKLKHKEVYIHQYHGGIISKAEIPIMSALLEWSIFLHTGKGSVIWSVVLALACLAILIFMYSGFAMSLKRLRRKSRFTNKFNQTNAEYVVLTGSETGHTLGFAQEFAKALLAASKSVFVDSLNNYSTYPNAKQLVIFTSTYGEGEAPSNASLFLSKLQTVQQHNTLNYAVVGFGSLLYPDYCQFAIDVDLQLQKLHHFSETLPLFKINNQSLEAFKTWLNEWAALEGTDLVFDHNKRSKPRRLRSFEVVQNSGLNTDDTFTLQLIPKQKTKYTSGDLLAVYPKTDEAERYYSIGDINGRITLSIKRHYNGMASNFLSHLQEGDLLKAKVRRNFDFHFPHEASEVILIANGTGIAPFLGMIHQNSSNIKTHLFWGGRNHESLNIYNAYIENALTKGTLSDFYIAFSQEFPNKIYVQDLIPDHKSLFSKVLNNNGIIMICGSITMQNGVLEQLNKLTTTYLNKPLSVFEQNDQLKMDCY